MNCLNRLWPVAFAIGTVISAQTPVPATLPTNPSPSTSSLVQHKTDGGWWSGFWSWMTDGTGGGGSQGSSAGCSGQAKGYPSGWTFKAVYKYSTTSNSICTAYLYQPDGSLDDCLGDGDCEMLCRDNLN